MADATTAAVSLFVMARDEQRCIARCINSVKQLVDEVVVLDTGSIDGTVDISRRLGCRVHQIEWPNDFSKARNIGLSLVKTPWVLMLDADEWALDQAVLREELRSLPSVPDNVIEVGMFMMPHGEKKEAAASLRAKLWTPRLFSSDLRFQKPVHEVLSHRYPIKRSEIILGHDGYEEEQQFKKRGRNLALLRRQLAVRPTDGLLCYYIAQQLQIDGFPTDPEIKVQFNNAIKFMPDGHPLKEIVFREALRYLEKVHDFDSGIRLIFESLQKGVRSAELSYVAANFLMRSSRANETSNSELLMSVAKTMFIRVATQSDQKSTYCESQVDLSRLAKKRLNSDFLGIPS